MMYHVTNNWLFGFYGVTENASNPNNVTGFESRSKAIKMCNHLNNFYDEINEKQPNSPFRKINHSNLQKCLQSFNG